MGLGLRVFRASGFRVVGNLGSRRCPKNLVSTIRRLYQAGVGEIGATRPLDICAASEPWLVTSKSPDIPNRKALNPKPLNP